MAGDPEISIDVARARVVAPLVAKAAKAIRLYPPESEIRRRFLEDLHAALEQGFTQDRALALRLGKTQILAHDEVVYEQRGEDEIFPGRLYWDGLREVAFHPGLPPDELTAFLEVLATADSQRDGGHEDVATLLWSRHFAHLTHLALDDLLDLEEGLDGDDGGEEFARGNFDEVDLEMHAASDREEVDRIGSNAQQRLARVLGDAPEVTFFRVAPAAMAALREELLAEESEGARRGALYRILRELFFLDREEEGLAALFEATRTRLEGCLARAEFGEARDLLSLVEEVAARRSDLTQLTREMAGEILGLRAEDALLAPLVQSLDRASGRPAGDLAAFVETLPAAGLPALVQVLGRLETLRARRYLLDLLPQRAAGHEELLIPFLEDPRWYLVRNVVLILGLVGSPRATEAVHAALAHEDARVRKEALKAIGTHGGTAAFGVLKGALRDPDPALRAWAARAVGTAGAHALRPLAEILNAEGFEERALDERQAFYDAYARAGGERAAPLLRAHLERKKMWKPAEPDPIRAGLCRALGAAGGAEAVAALDAHIEDRSPLVREAARAARAAAGRSAEDAA